MAYYSNLPVYDDCMKLLVSYEQALADLSPDIKQDFGSEVRETLIEVMVCVYRAKAVVDRYQNIQSAIDNLVRAQILLNLMNELNAISPDQFTALSNGIMNISKQLSAWRQKSRK